MMCRIKGFIRNWSMRFTPTPAEEAKCVRDNKNAAKLRKLAKKQKELERLRSKK